MGEGSGDRQDAILVDVTRRRSPKEEPWNGEEHTSDEIGGSGSSKNQEGDGKQPGEPQALSSEAGVHTFTQGRGALRDHPPG